MRVRIYLLHFVKFRWSGQETMTTGGLVVSHYSHYHGLLPLPPQPWLHGWKHCKEKAPWQVETSTLDDLCNKATIHYCRVCDSCNIGSYTCRGRSGDLGTCLSTGQMQYEFYHPREYFSGFLCWNCGWFIRSESPISGIHTLHL